MAPRAVCGWLGGCLLRKRALSLRAEAERHVGMWAFPRIGADTATSRAAIRGDGLCAPRWGHGVHPSPSLPTSHHKESPLLSGDSLRGPRVSHVEPGVLESTGAPGEPQVHVPPRNHEQVCEGSDGDDATPPHTPPHGTNWHH